MSCVVVQCCGSYHGSFYCDLVNSLNNITTYSLDAICDVSEK